MLVQGHQRAASLVVSCIYAILWTINIDTLTFQKKERLTQTFTIVGRYGVGGPGYKEHWPGGIAITEDGALVVNTSSFGFWQTTSR